MPNPPNRHHRLGSVTLLAVCLALVPACSKEVAGPEIAWGQTVRGTVTYKGQPVPYGVVLFYNHTDSIDPNTGLFIPSAIGEIHQGDYEALNVPSGHVMVCVATDPDAHPAELTAPRPLGGTMPAVGDPDEVPVGPHLGPAGIPPGEFINPLTESLSDNQKRMLKEIHAKYGIVGKSPLAHIVKEGEQTYDIPLK